MNNRGSSLVSTVLAVAAAAGVGVAGYFMLAGDCSSCTTSAADALTPVAAVSAETEGASCCATDGAAVETVSVLVDSECCATDAEACCEGENAEACETKCEAEGAVETVSLTTDGACAEKAEACTESAEACEGKVCPITGEPIADSGN